MTAGGEEKTKTTSKKLQYESIKSVGVNRRPSSAPHVQHNQSEAQWNGLMQSRRTLTLFFSLLQVLYWHNKIASNCQSNNRKYNKRASEAENINDWDKIPILHKQILTAINKQGASSLNELHIIHIFLKGTVNLKFWITQSVAVIQDMFFYISDQISSLFFFC